jgi:hypothetical protein
MKRFRRYFVVAWVAGVFLSLLLGCGLGKNPATLPGEVSVAEDTSWEAVFQRKEGWTGADGINTADLLDGRILWLFGDTWIGDIQQGRHAPEAELVNNTLAVHETPKAGNWVPPGPKDIRFFWGRSGRDNQAWIRPDSAGGSSWYWPAGNGLVVKDGFDGLRLLFFMSKLSRRPGSNEMWNFSRSGNTLVMVANPGEKVSDWRIRTISVPVSLWRGEKIGWGVALLSVPVSGEFTGNYVYIYGIDETDLGNKKLILVRSPAGRVDDTVAWQAYRGNGLWGTVESECHPIAEHLATELSVEPVTIGKNRWYVMVHSEDGFGSHILIRMAQHPQGPWSKPFPVYQVQGIRNDTALFTYAAKSHACLSRPGELLISYVINAFDFDMLTQDADLYRPRFIRISLNQLLQKVAEIVPHNDN